ncbi:MAG: helix-turn-helix transcriptional regulator [Verrucomicrobiae bacterium]
MNGTSKELAQRIADRIRLVRLTHEWSQVEVAARAGVAVDTYRLFERTGKISLERLLRVAIALHRSRDFELLLVPAEIRSIDDLEEAKRPARKRGRSTTA